MNISRRIIFPRPYYLLVALSGFAALSWEVMWQIKISLALGVSAWGTAITLAVIMGGMSLGGFMMGNALRAGTHVQAIRLYGLLEILTGLAGIFLNSAFWTLEKLDTWAYIQMPNYISLIYIFGIITILAVPAFCMGGTLPLFGAISKRYQHSVTQLYSLNILGAAVGVFFVAMILIPMMGVTHTIWTVAVTNIMVGLMAWFLNPGELVTTAERQNKELFFQPLLTKDIFIVFVTGFATFALEIAWFRAFAAIFPNTTDVFAILLACMLIALGLAAKKIPMLKLKNRSLATQLCLSGILILLITPLIERIDTLMIFSKQVELHSSDFVSLNWFLINPDTFIINWTGGFLYTLQFLLKFIVIYFIIVPPLLFLGVAFPWILDSQSSARAMGRLYAINTLAAIVGSISAAWLLLPTIGFAKTTWIAGGLIIIAGLLITSGRKRFILSTLGMMALLFAIFFETGIGKIRTQGFYASDEKGKLAKVLEAYAGPDANVSAVEYGDKARALLINSALAAWESGEIYRPSAHYMAWMGHLPMLIHPDPKNTLVICFGTGQTANAVRKENPKNLDIVDINSNVFKLAHHFKSNEDVLNDPKAKAIVMDGRAYLRRTRKMYDVITLEPMPPITTGVNALYSKEFYELAHNKLTPNGVIAQWLPFHVAAPYYNASIAKTFMKVFPNSILWIDRDSKTGVLLGTKGSAPILSANWPGFSRTHIKRNLSLDEVQQYVALNTEQLKQYSAYGEIINDDNQLLAYGKALYATGLLELNFELLHRVNKKIFK